MDSIFRLFYGFRLVLYIAAEPRFHGQRVQDGTCTFGWDEAEPHEMDDFGIVVPHAVTYLTLPYPKINHGSRPPPGPVYLPTRNCIDVRNSSFRDLGTDNVTEGAM